MVVTVWSSLCFLRFASHHNKCEAIPSPDFGQVSLPHRWDVNSSLFFPHLDFCLLFLEKLFSFPFSSFSLCLKFEAFKFQKPPSW